MEGAAVDPEADAVAAGGDLDADAVGVGGQHRGRDGRRSALKRRLARWTTRSAPPGPASVAISSSRGRGGGTRRAAARRPAGAARGDRRRRPRGSNAGTVMPAVDGGDAFSRKTRRARKASGARSSHLEDVQLAAEAGDRCEQPGVRRQRVQRVVHQQPAHPPGGEQRSRSGFLRRLDRGLRPPGEVGVQPLGRGVQLVAQAPDRTAERDRARRTSGARASGCAARGSAPGAGCEGPKR